MKKMYTIESVKSYLDWDDFTSPAHDVKLYYDSQANQVIFKKLDDAIKYCIERLCLLKKENFKDTKKYTYCIVKDVEKKCKMIISLKKCLNNHSKKDKDKYKYIWSDDNIALYWIREVVVI